MPAVIVMSKKFRPIRLFFGVLGLTLQFFTFAAAQDLTATLSVDGKRPTELRVSGVFTKERPLNESHVLAFEENVAGVSIDARRILSPSAKDKSGRDLQLISVPRCCIATGKIDRFSYVVELNPKDNIRAEAHTSWLRDGVGILRLGDLLPQEFLPSGKRRSAELQLELPNNWRVFSADELASDGSISIADIDSAVIFVGKGWNDSYFDRQGIRFTVLSTGESQFSQVELQEKVRPIVSQYSTLYGGLSSDQYTLAIFRPNAAFANWEADTRGRSIVIASAGMPFKSQTLQQLDEQLRHELFHLWIPNGVSLSGRYDWFYEGFALYSSLRLAVDKNTIRFDDMLDTMSRALTVRTDDVSNVGLLDLAKDRYNGREKQLYAYGLAFAFICDLALNVASKGKRNSDMLVREIFQQYRAETKRVDGNETILRKLNAYPELQPHIQQYVFGQGRRDVGALVSLLESSGFEWATDNGRSKLTVKPKLSSRQKAILDKLGYNSWRKLVKDSK